MKVRFESGKSSSNDWICLLLLRNPRSEVKASWEQKIADFLLCSGDTFGGGEARLKVKNKKTWTRKMKEFFLTQGRHSLKDLVPGCQIARVGGHPISNNNGERERGQIVLK